MKLHFLLRFALLLTLLASPVRARAAATDGARLEYARTDRAASCPDQDALKGAVAKRLGYDPFLPAAHRTVVVEITDTESGLRGQMRLVDPQGIIRGSRELSEGTGHCDELVASLALAISIALDPSAAPDTTPTLADPPRNAAQPPAPAAPPEPAPAAPSPSPAPAAPPAQAKRAEAVTLDNREAKQSRFALRATGFGALGAAPAQAFGFRLGASATWAWFRLVAELSDQLPVSKTQDHVGVAKASLLSTALAPCVVYASISVCAVFDVGSLHVEGNQILDSNNERLSYATLGARFEFAPRLVGRLHLLTNIGLATVLTPVTLKIHGQTVWKSPALSANLGIGLGWHF